MQISSYVGLGRYNLSIDTIPDTSINKRKIPIEPNITTELQGPKLQTKATESIATEPEQLKPKVEAEEDNNASHSKGKEPMLAKYVKRNHSLDLII